MPKKIYVGNLPYSASEEDLREAFAKFGELQSVRIIMDEATGSSKGFGFVEMAVNEDADKAIEALNGAMLKGRAMRVSEARPQEARGKGGPRGGGGRGPGWR